MKNKKMEKEREIEILKVEYEQTIQTLRNWDTLFFNAFVSTIIGGGIGAFASLLGKEIQADIIRIILLIIISALYCIFLLYVTYNFSIARRKFQILKEIEIEAKMKGAYKNHNSKSWLALWFTIIPIVTLIFALIFILIFNAY
jgi:ABC-type dipeptide/oligopeptide/nickel transport system permease component